MDMDVRLHSSRPTGRKNLCNIVEPVVDQRGHRAGENPGRDDDADENEDDHGRHRLSQGLLHALHQIVKLVAQRGGYQAGNGQRDEQDDVDVKSQDYDA